MQSAFEEFLQDISDCFTRGDVELWCKRIKLPLSIVTRIGHIIFMPDKDSLVENFGLYMRSCDAMNLDMVDRRAISLEDCKDGTWLGTYETRLISRNVFTSDAYTSTSLLHLEDGFFKMSSVLNGRGHWQRTGDNV